MDRLVTIDEIAMAMRRDQQRLRHWHSRLERSRGAERDRQREAWQRFAARSIELSAQRRQLASRPIALDPSLPIAAFADRIVQSLRGHPVTIVSGEAGSGKSTQLPLMALQAGLGIAGSIGHTQPRRIAARGVAARLAQQLDSPLGQIVGFKIRFSDETSPQTLIKVMTDGVLLAETQRDRQLDAYDCLIIDEAHERSLNIDLLIGYLKRLLERRRDLRVIITSATLDTERFAMHFANAGEPAPVIEVPGRAYPIEIRYEPPAESAGESPAEAVAESCLRLLRETHQGDVLVFLPTENDIRMASNQIRADASERCEVLPLYARLTMAQQSAIFEPHARRRVVLATNVAESSITVPGIRFVIDCGTARISRYAARSKVQRLPIEPISQASANQRAGRCGRVGPGICIRLYDEADFLARPPYTTPEIRRTNLAGTILQMLALHLGDLLEFPLIDPPSPELVRDGYRTLIELGAIDEARVLTPLGKQMSRFPVDPRVSRMMLEAFERRCLGEVLIIASGLEVPDPSLRPRERQAAADAAHARWCDDRSDFVTMLNLWDFVHRLRDELSRSQFRKALEQNFLSPSLIQQWFDVHRQLLAMAQEQRLPPGPRRGDFDAIHQSISSGLLSGVAQKQDRGEYLGADNVRFVLWPGSSVVRAMRRNDTASVPQDSHQKKKEPKSAGPAWIIAAEVVETSRRFGRTVAGIQPQWLEELAAHLLKRQYSDPFWNEKRESVMAYESLSLFGLRIVNRRAVSFAAIDPSWSREVFIEQGLADSTNSTFPFQQHNLDLLQGIEGLARKLRKRELIVESHLLVRFYRNRLPAEAVDGRALRRLLKQQPELDRQLRMTLADFGIDSASVPSSEAFPDRLQVGSLQLPVHYEFAPGAAGDGASIDVPIESLNQIDEVQLGWSIPGILGERVSAMIRSLPKSVRRSLVPAPEVAQRVQRQWKFNTGDFWQEVARQLSQIAGEPIPVEQFDRKQIPPQLLINIRVRGDDGELLAESRSLQELNEKFGRRPQHIDQLESPWHRDGLTDWTWDDLPNSVELQRGEVRMTAFPTIVDQGNAVGLRLSDTRERADHTTRRGLVRLIQIARRRDLRSQINWLPAREECEVKLSRWLTPEALRDQLGDLMVRIAMGPSEALPIDLASYRRLLERSGGLIAGAAADVARWLPQLAEGALQVALCLEQNNGGRGPLREELQEQLNALLADGFLATVPWERLQCFPRYLTAMTMRWEKSRGAAPGAVDRAGQQIAEFWSRYRDLHQRHVARGWQDAELDLFRWMIEEFRVSTFAQSLGTSFPVSAQRLEKQWKRVKQ